MKKVFYSLAVIAALVFATGQASAQETFGNAGVELGIPIGDWSEDFFTFAVGGSGGIEIGVSDQFGITGNAGIQFLALDDAAADFVSSAFLVPVQVGGRYYLDEQREGLFLEAKVGIHLYNVSFEDVENPIPGGEDLTPEDQSEVYLSAAPQVGFFLNENISLALRYQLFFISEDEEIGREGDTGSLIGLKAAYNF